jgi:acid phosphatase
MARSYSSPLILIVVIASQCLITGCESESTGTHELLNAVLWVQTAAEYSAACEQNFTTARVRLDQALEDSQWTAAVEQKTSGAAYGELPPAIICDVDETVLSNSRFDARLVADGIEYNQDLWKDWVKEASAPPLPGAKAFIDYARAKGVSVFFVTNRKAVSKDKTLANLRTAFGPEISEDELLCRGETDEWGPDKKTRRSHLAKTHRILLLLGDDLNDFISFGEAPPEERVALAHDHRDRWGTKWIIFPNPIYGSWERSLYGYEDALSHSAKLQQKLGVLDIQK